MWGKATGQVVEVQESVVGALNPKCTSYSFLQNAELFDSHIPLISKPVSGVYHFRLPGVGGGEAVMIASSSLQKDFLHTEK